jgi:diguanylate cyclase (GGDEF)-like protein/PAS domain S-box-containing protein
MIRWILFVSVAATLALPLFAARFVHPSFNDLLEKLTEEEAIRLATHLASDLPSGPASFNKEVSSVGVGEEIEEFRRDINLVKIKVFSPEGETLHSTENKEIGEVNSNRYFHEIVARGTPHTKVVRKKSISLEGKEMQTDVVETYVPIMEGGRFVGAFEIYYDISKSKENLDRLIRRSTYAVTAVTVGLLLAVFLASQGAHRTIQERNRIQEALSESERKYRDLYDHAPDMYYSLDREGNFIDCNETGLSMLGYTREELIGRSIREFFSERSKEVFDKDFMSLFRDAKEVLLEREFIRKDGSMIVASINASSEFDREGRPIRINAITRDISERKEMEAALRELAETDSLTNISNRRVFHLHLDAAMELFRRYRNPFSVVLFDIDHFKRVNDTYGHDVGDSVLQKVAEIVGSNLRKSDLLARYGGEEFVVLSPEMNAEGALAFAEKIRRIVAHYDFPGVGRVTVSAGAALSTEGEETRELIRRVDEAMYAAKRNGRNRVEFAG